MITANYIIENQWNKGELFTKTEWFSTIEELEKFLAYNRNYIQEITFQGSIKEENI